jgi:MFS family permease
MKLNGDPKKVMQASNKKNFLVAASPLFLIIAIDGMGLGLIIPILNILLMRPESPILAVATSGNMRNFLYGIVLGVFMLCWFFGAAFLGDLSDQIGRKKSLLICLVGGALGFLLSAIGVSVGSLTLLIIGRIAAGLTSGSQSIAQAAIIDISPREHKARNIGLILFFSSIGFIIGPLIGGFFSDSQLVFWFTLSTPLYVSALLALLNALLLSWLFKETFTLKPRQAIKLHRAIEVLISGFREEKVRSLSVILLIMLFGWSSFYSFVSSFLLHEYKFSVLHISLFMAALSVGFGIGTGFVVDPLAKRFSLKGSIVVNLFICAFAIAVMVLSGHVLYAWVCIIPIGACIATAYAMLLTLFSNQVATEHQGWVMGITSSILAFAFGINGVLTGILSDVGPCFPLLISVVYLVASALLMGLYKNQAARSYYAT